MTKQTYRHFVLGLPLLFLLLYLIPHTTASNINAGNVVSLKTAKSGTTLIQGSNIGAGNAIIVDTGTLNIRASKDTYKTRTESEHVNAHASVSSAGGYSASIGGDKSHAKTSGTTHNNSTLSAKNISLTSANDTNIKGANIHGTESLTYHVGGNLNIASVQDVHKSANHSVGASVGISGSTGTGNLADSGKGAGVRGVTGANGGFNTANGNSYAKTTVLTTATGGKVVANVGGNTDIKGALLSGGNFDKEGKFVANNNLALHTKTLTHSDLSNVNHTSSVSASVNVNTSLNNEKVNANDPTTTDKAGVRIDTTHIGYTNNQNHTKTKTLATLGGGSVKVGGKEYTNSTLNRNSATVDKDIYNVTQNKGNIDMTIDNRMFTTEGRKEIAEDFERTKRLGGAIVDVTTKDAFKAKDTLGHISDLQKDLDVQKAMALEQDGKFVEVLDDKNRDKYTIEERDEALNAYAQIYAKTYGVNIDEAKSVATKKYKGMAYTNAEGTSSTVYIDDNHNNGALDTAHAMGHEVAHVREQQGQTRDRTKGVDAKTGKRLSEEYAETMGSYSAKGMEFSSNTYNNVQLDNTLPTHRAPRSQADKATLSTNTDGLIANVNRAKSGDGTVDPMSLPTYNIIKDKANSGDKSAQLHLALLEENLDVEKIDQLKENLTEEEIASIEIQVKDDKKGIVVEGDYGDLAVLAVKEAVTYIPPVGTSIAIYEGIKNGNIVGMVVEEAVLRKLGPVGDKIKEYGGRLYAKVDGVVKDVTDSVKRIEVKVNPNTISANGLGGVTVGVKPKQTVKEFEKEISKLPPGERVAKIKEKVQEVVKDKKLIKDKTLSKKTGRDVYKDEKGNIYSVDTQHGRFEMLNKKGKHIDEVDFDLKPQGKTDKSGGHNLNVK